MDGNIPFMNFFQKIGSSLIEDKKKFIETNRGSAFIICRINENDEHQRRYNSVPLNEHNINGGHSLHAEEAMILDWTNFSKKYIDSTRTDINIVDIFINMTPCISSSPCRIDLHDTPLDKREKGETLREGTRWPQGCAGKLCKLFTAYPKIKWKVFCQQYYKNRDVYEKSIDGTLAFNSCKNVDFRVMFDKSTPAL